MSFCSLHKSEWASQCGKDSGPSGVAEYVQLANYNRYQWSTCLTNTYIQQKKVDKGTFVKTLLQLIACTSACLRCITKLPVQCQRTVPVNVPIQHPAHTTFHRTHLYLRNARAHLTVIVTGVAAAWRESILVKLLAMHTPYDTLRSFASCMTSDTHYSVQMGRSGWTVFVNAFRSFLCHCCIHG